MNQFHQSNYQQGQTRQICLGLESKQRGREGMVSIRLPCQGHPSPLMQPWRITNGQGVTCQPAHSVTCFPTQLDQVATCYS